MHVRKLKGDAVAHYDAQIAEHAEENRDRDACHALWRTVIERTVMDLQYLERFAGRNNLKKHELEKLRRIEESPPTDFLEGSWFEQICDYLQVDAARIRSGLGNYLQEAA